MTQAPNLASIPWIPDEAKRAKYEEKDDRVAASDNPLTGTFTNHSTRENFRKDGHYNVVTLTTEDGRDVDVHCQSTVLARQMLDARPSFGEKVTVAYLGMVQGKDTSVQPYSNYKVKVERELGGQPRWAGATPDDSHVVYEQPAQAAPAPTEAQTAGTPSDDDIPFDR